MNIFRRVKRYYLKRESDGKKIILLSEFKLYPGDVEYIEDEKYVVI